MKYSRFCLSLLAGVLLSGCTGTGVAVRFRVGDEPYYHPPVRVYHQPRTVVVNEKVWDPHYGWVWVRHTVTAYWDEGCHCYFWRDRHGRPHRCN